MHCEDRLQFRPQLESLEERCLPNNFSWIDGVGGGILNALSHSAATTSAAASHSSSTAGSSAPSSSAPPGNDGNPGVAPVQSNPYGASYAEWSARWWQYAFSVPADKNPFFDYTGANFAVGQSGNVWYLSGVIVFTQAGQPPPTSQNPATAVRDVTLPSGTSLFFPVLNVEEDNLVPGGPNTNYSVSQLRAFAAQSMDSAENLQVEIDGRAVQDLSDYRVQSPVFSYTLPDNNIDTVLTGVTTPAQTVSPAVSDGVFLMLRPLSVGQHTIEFSGDFGPGNFALDVTYHITVAPGK